MVFPSTFAETVTPPIFSPESDFTVPASKAPFSSVPYARAEAESTKAVAIAAKIRAAVSFWNEARSVLMAAAPYRQPLLR